MVDDDDDGRSVVAAILELEGYSVSTAVNGADALERARCDQPSIILLDLMMPVMDGREFRAWQATDPTIAHIPVLVVSAHSDVAAIARQIGARGFIEKPIVFTQLLSRLETLLKKPHGRGPEHIAPGHDPQSATYRK